MSAVKKGTGKLSMAAVRPRYLPLPSQDAPDRGRLILRDGTTATLRPARPEDRAAMADFFARLSPASRIQRFFSQAPPSAALIESFCENSDPHAALNLIVLRTLTEEPQIVAAGSYIVKAPNCAEIALAVEDKFQGRGIGTLLLERLALVAATNGIRRFWAVTSFENQAMLDVFCDSGFPCQRKTEAGDVEVDLSLLPSKSTVESAELRDRVATAASLRPFFYPNAVAVIGASRNPASIGTRLLNAVIAAGFHGAVYPVNPKATAIGSLRAYASLRDLPEAPDLAVIAVPRDAVLAVVDDCAACGVRAVIVITAGFSEIGPAGRGLQRRLGEKDHAPGRRQYSERQR